MSFPVPKAYQVNKIIYSDDSVLNLPPADSDFKNMIERDIKTAVIPGGTSKIGNSAFYNCSELETVVLPDTVTYIDSFAFGLCAKLKLMICYSIIPPQIKTAKSIEGWATDFVVRVPAGSVNAYKSANIWSTIADHIEGL